MSPVLGERHQEAVRFPPAEPSDRHLSVGPVTMIWPCLLTPVGVPSNATKAARASSALACGHGCPGEQVPSISRAAMPASRSRGPSSHQIGPSPSQTWVGVHSNVWPLGMTGTSALASKGLIARTANPRMTKCNRRYWMAGSFLCLVRYHCRSFPHRSSHQMPLTEPLPLTVRRKSSCHSALTFRAKTTCLPP